MGVRIVVQAQSNERNSMTKPKKIWGLFYLGEEIDRFDGAVGEGVPWTKAEATKKFMLDCAIEVKEIKEEDVNEKR
jgi:hypothetical protein